MSEPRSWSLHGFTVIHRDMEIGEVTHCEYKERIIGSKIGEAVVDVIEKSAFDELKRENEKLKGDVAGLNELHTTNELCINNQYKELLTERAKSDSLAKQNEILRAALLKISAAKTMTVASDSGEFMDGAHTAYCYSAEYADDALAEVAKLEAK